MLSWLVGSGRVGRVEGEGNGVELKSFLFYPFISFLLCIFFPFSFLFFPPGVVHLVSKR